MIMKRANETTRKHCLGVLGLGHDAGIEEIQAAYRKLVFTYHPDRNRRPGASRRFREIVEAYGALMEEIQVKRIREGDCVIERVRSDPAIGTMSLAELAQRMRYSSSPLVRASAAAAAGLSRDEDSRRLLLDALGDEDECVVNVALKMLSERGDRRTIGPLLLHAVGRRSPAGARAAGCVLSKSLKALSPGISRNLRDTLSLVRG